MAIKITGIVVKLIRLANNNSNEHEANSAARRACKMIGEELDKIPSQTRSRPPTDSGFSYWEDIFRAAYKRQEQTNWDDFGFRPPKQEKKYRSCGRCGAPYERNPYELPIGPHYCKACNDEIRAENDRAREAQEKAQAEQQRAYRDRFNPWSTDYSTAMEWIKIQCPNCSLKFAIPKTALFEKEENTCVRCGYKIKTRA